MLTLPARLSRALLLAAGFAAATALAAQTRVPAVPLVTHNPSFSLWSMSDRLTGSPTRHWTGAEQPLTGLVRIDGVAYRFLGAWPEQVKPLDQTALQIEATHTRYQFSGAGIKLQLTFFTPALPTDLDTLSRPVTYLDWQVESADGKPHAVSLLLDADPVLAVNTADQPVTWGRLHPAGLTDLAVGSRDQQPVNRSGDNLRIDWGYLHLAVPDGQQARTALSPDALDAFIQSGSIPAEDQLEMPRAPQSGAAHLAVEFSLGSVGTTPIKRHVLLAYTQGPAIEYLGRRLPEYWQRNGKPAGQMLAEAERQYEALEARSTDFDRELRADLEQAGGKNYADLAILAYRQTLAAHQLAADVDGTPLLFPKENFSNGCISTVDVLYPSAPFYLLLSPQLLEAQLKPVLDYAELPRWRWPFAPHDLGQFPLANGQVYGGGERTEEDQMPVEESGNLLILVAALGQAQGDWHVAQRYWPLMSKWANYLLEKGLDPDNQLSTDDFAGHLAHNANLSIKAIEGLAAYARMAEALGHPKEAAEFGAKAHSMAARWPQMGLDAGHYRLAFDKPGTWSQKYNLVWDQLLDLKLFPPEIRQTELAFYEKQFKPYGLPLDSRAGYTKLDWEIWTATMAPDRAQFERFLAPIAEWLKQTPSRVPLTDWYQTGDGKQVGFQARSVVGGIYIRALADKQIAAKWQQRARLATAKPLKIAE
jgi:hypothetical protein